MTLQLVDDLHFLCKVVLEGGLLPRVVGQDSLTAGLVGNCRARLLEAAVIRVARGQSLIP